MKLTSEESEKKRAKLQKYVLSLRVDYKAPDTPYGSLRKTRKNRKKKLETVSSQIEAFAFWPVYNTIYRIVKMLQYVAPKEDDWNNLSYFLECNEIMQPTIKLCVKEFYVFLVEMQTAAYTGAARTLRCIIETAVDACEFQSGVERPTMSELLEKYDSIKQTSNKAEEMIKLMMGHNAWISYLERYRIHEEIKRIAPTFRELTKRLNSREFFREDPSIYKNLKSTCERLSDYVHPSLEEIKALMTKSRKTQFPKFAPKTFDSIHELGVTTLDVVAFLYVKSISSFYGFASAKAFLKDFAKRVEQPQEVIDSFRELHHFSRLSKGIVWKRSKS